MMKSWSFILAIVCLNLVLTNGEEQIQQVIAELRNQTSEIRQEQVDEIGKILKNVEAMMDPTVNPCGNFYQFVCGKYSKQSRNSSEYANDEIKNRLISKYEQEDPLESENKMKVIKHSRNLYKSCKRTKNKKGYNDFILRDLEAIGGWPALKGDSWNSSAFDWKRSVFKAGNIYEWPDYLFFIIKRERNYMKYLSLEPIYYDAENTLEWADHLGGNNSIVKEELEKVNEFWKNFSTIHSLNRNMRRRSMKLTLQNLTDQYPFYPWYDHLRSLQPNIQLNDTIDVTCVPCLENLHSLLNNTDKRILANIAAGNRVQDLFESVPQLYESDCFTIMSSLFQPALGFMYIHEFSNDNKTKEAKQLAETISNNIREQFIEMVRNADWISNKTYLIETLEKLYYQFDYPLNQVYDDALNKYYDHFQLDETNFYNSFYNTLKYRQHNRYDETNIWHQRELREYIEKMATKSTSIKYNKTSNSILMRLTLLLSHFIDIKNPMWMNFASFGSIIGHEFGRSLDPYSTKSDYDFPTWFEDRTIRNEYRKRIRCLSDMYRDIANVSSNLRARYQFELEMSQNNAADNLGFKGAYLAYKSLPIKGNSLTLHQKEYSPDQLFWIYATNRLCSAQVPLTETFKHNMKIEDNSQKPEELRILGSLSNIEGFSRDFNCPENSPMNRQQRCSIF